MGYRVPPAEANTRAERNAPIAPVVPKAFEEFGGVRIDNYDWLRGRKDPRVLAYHANALKMPVNQELLVLPVDIDITT